MLEKLRRIVVTAGLVLGQATSTAAPSAQAAAPPAGQPRLAFVSATEAAALVSGGATVLADVARIAQKLEARGVDSRRPVLIYGDAQRGFGEEGRIAWMLAYLGHPDVAILDGGIAAWQQAGQALLRGLSDKVAPGARFVPSPQPTLRADKQAVRDAERNRTIVLDVRSREEFFGATPYFEKRGGHIPGARHLDWRAALNEHGRLRPAPEVAALLTPLGVDKEAEVIVYCTGGVRSAFALTLLRSLGFFRVRNYDASFWEWAADPSLRVETAASLSGAPPSPQAPR
jgi:thiosulfate/3-mercaptopyruvate sulfurtransferase